MKSLLRHVRISAGLVSLFLVGVAASAQSSPTDPGGGTAPTSGGATGQGLMNPLKNINSLWDLLAAILQLVVDIGWIFVTLMLIYVGFLFVAAQGNDEKLKNARSALVWTVIGGLILLGAQSIALFLKATGAALTG